MFRCSYFLLCLGVLIVVVVSSSASPSPVSPDRFILLVQLYADTAVGPSFPAVGLPVAIQNAATPATSTEPAISDMYGIARLSILDTAQQASLSLSYATTSAAATVLSINEQWLPHHRPDWSASRWHLHLPRAMVATMPTEEATVYIQLHPKSPPQAFRPVSRRTPSAAVNCLLLTTFAVLGASLCGLLFSLPLRRRRSRIVLPSVALRLQALPTTSSGGGNSGSSSSNDASLGVAAGMVCCQCSQCCATSAHPLSTAPVRQQPISRAIRQFMRAWQSDSEHRSHQSALVIYE